MASPGEGGLLVTFFFFIMIHYSLDDFLKIDYYFPADIWRISYYFLGDFWGENLFLKNNLILFSCLSHSDANTYEMK